MRRLVDEALVARDVASLRAGHEAVRGELRATMCAQVLRRARSTGWSADRAGRPGLSLTLGSRLYAVS